MANYYLILTDHGSQCLAAAQAGTTDFQILHLALGDANGQPYLPSSRINANTLVNERARVDVMDVTVVGQHVEVLAIVGSEIGGFHLHEIALLDEQGKALYIGNYHGGYKPVLTEGAGGDLKLILALKTSGLAPVVIQMNPTTVVADRQWVIDNFVRIPTFDAHVNQNALEHANLLLLIQQLNQMLAHTNEELMDTQVVQQIQQTLILMQERLTILERNRFEDIKIGDVFITTTYFADSASVAAHKGYGLWQPEATGRYMVGAGVGVDEAGIQKSIATGDKFGVYQIIQSESQVGLHRHALHHRGGIANLDVIQADTQGFSGSDADTLSGYTDGNRRAEDVEPMPINPPYQAFGIWRRTA